VAVLSWFSFIGGGWVISLQVAEHGIVDCRKQHRHCDARCSFDHIYFFVACMQNKTKSFELITMNLARPITWQIQFEMRLLGGGIGDGGGRCLAQM
jgi:hypothetical protein